MGAVMNNHAETVRILLKAGARLDLTTNLVRPQQLWQRPRATRRVLQHSKRPS